MVFHLRANGNMTEGEKHPVAAVTDAMSSP